MFEVPSWSMISNPFSIRHQAGFETDKLLITVGDSWTYGDSLGNTKVREGRDDTEYRLDHVYGQLMARTMDVDWMNLALPGGSNILMVNWVSLLLDRLDSFQTYKDITCVVTLTESGRHEDLQLIDKSLGTQQRVLEKILFETYGKLTFIMLKHPHIKFLVAHNFTDGASSMPCQESWLEVMLGKQIQNGTHIVVSEHIDQMNYDSRFPDVLDIMDRAAARMDLLDQCQYCYKEDSRHPNEHGHAIWANYLLSKL